MGDMHDLAKSVRFGIFENGLAVEEIPVGHEGDNKKRWFDCKRKIHQKQKEIEANDKTFTKPFWQGWDDEQVRDSQRYDRERWCEVRFVVPKIHN